MSRSLTAAWAPMTPPTTRACRVKWAGISFGISGRAINELYAWYKRRGELDIESLRFDEKDEIGANT